MKVVIFNEGFIPGLGTGPFKTPVEISEDKFYLYKRMGLNVIRADKSVPIAEAGIRNRPFKKEEIYEPVDEIVEEKPVIKETKVDTDTQIKQKQDVENLKESVEESNETAVELDIVSEDFIEDDNDESEEYVEEETEEVETPSENDEELEVDINSLTKKELLEVLTDAGIDCNNNMTKSQLIELAETL